MVEDHTEAQGIATEAQVYSIDDDNDDGNTGVETPEPAAVSSASSNSDGSDDDDAAPTVVSSSSTTKPVDVTKIPPKVGERVYTRYTNGEWYWGKITKEIWKEKPGRGLRREFELYYSVSTK